MTPVVSTANRTLYVFQFCRFQCYNRRGRIFSKEGTSAGPWMCVHVFQGLTVGWWEEEKHSSDHHREAGRVRIPAGWATHGCCVVCVLYCGGKYPGAQLHHLKKELADRKVPDRPNDERGKLKLLISWLLFLWSGFISFDHLAEIDF
jgi:hypothetical protein